MIDFLRKESRSGYIEENNEYMDLQSSNQYSDLQEILHDAVDLLPVIQKAVILLRDYEGYSYKEIAEITGLNEPQVKVYIYRARVFLRKYFGKLEVVI